MENENEKPNEAEKSEYSDVRALIDELRAKGHSDKEIVDFLESLADKGQLELEGADEGEGEKKVGDESQKEYDFHQDEKNYDEGKEIGEEEVKGYLGHGFH